MLQCLLAMTLVALSEHQSPRQSLTDLEEVRSDVLLLAERIKG